MQLLFQLYFHGMCPSAAIEAAERREVQNPQELPGEVVRLGKRRFGYPTVPNHPGACMKKPHQLLTIALAAAALMTSGCESPSTREQGGMVIGGILGGILGAQVGQGSGRTAATLLGAMAGTVIGGSVGRSMAETDRLKTAHTLETVRTGVSSRWINPDTGNSYVVVPTRTFEQSGAPCRDYTINATIGGSKEQVVGTACRQPDGRWNVVN